MASCAQQRSRRSYRCRSWRLRSDRVPCGVRKFGLACNSAICRVGASLCTRRVRKFGRSRFAGESRRSPRGVRFANSGGLVFVDESAEEVATV